MGGVDLIDQYISYYSENTQVVESFFENDGHVYSELVDIFSPTSLDIIQVNTGLFALNLYMNWFSHSYLSEPAQTPTLAFLTVKGESQCQASAGC